MDRDESPELIKEQTEQTAQSLATKVAALETKLVGTIADAQTTVEETVKSVQESVQSVKSAVEDTVTSVKDTVTGSVESVSDNIKGALDVRTHVEANPWAAVGAAAAAGFVTGLLIGGRRGEPPFDRLAEASPEPMSSHSFHAVTSAPAARAVEPRKPGMFDELFDMARKEVAALGKQALNQLVTSARAALDQKVPEMVNHFADRIPAQFGAGGAAAGAGASHGQGTERGRTGATGGGFQQYT